MDFTPIGAIASLVRDGIDKIWPSKTQEEKDRAALLMAQLQAQVGLVQQQLAIDLAAEQGKSMLQHFRDGAGWVCVFGFAWAYVLQPMLNWGCAAFGHPVTFPTLNTADMSDLLAGLLGLGTLHAGAPVLKSYFDNKGS